MSNPAHDEDAPSGVIRSWTVDVVDMFQFEDMLREAAERTKDPNAPLKAGSWCRWCKAQAVCPEAERAALEESGLTIGEDGRVSEMPDPVQIDPERLGAMLATFQALEQWIKAVREFAHTRLEAGKPVAGWKLVEKRATRKWGDENAVIDALRAAGYSDGEILKDPELRTPPQIEKLVGKPTYRETVEAHVVKASSGTTMAPLDDKRDAVNPVAGFADAEPVDFDSLQ